MIQHFSIDSFKSVKHVQLELGVVNFFIGPNGSGKSNLLEALGVVSAAVHGRIDDESLLRRGVRPGLPQLYKSSFKNERIRRLVTFSVKDGNTSYSLGIDNPIKSPERAWNYHSEGFVDKGRRIAGTNPRAASAHGYDTSRGQSNRVLGDIPAGSSLAQLLNILLDYAIFSPNTQTLRGLTPDQQQRDPIGLCGGRLPEAVEDLLRDARKRDKLLEFTALIDWADRVYVTSPANMPLSPSVSTGKHVLGFRDRYMLESRGVLSGYDASEGALYALFLAVLALHDRTPRLYAIDNADHGLNPLLAKRLFHLFCTVCLERERGQCLLTTHNPLVLDGIPLDDPRVRLFVVERASAGSSQVRQIVIDDKLRGFVGKGWTLSRLWTGGYLGGVPNV